MHCPLSCSDLTPLCIYLHLASFSHSPLPGLTKVVWGSCSLAIMGTTDKNVSQKEFWFSSGSHGSKSPMFPRFVNHLSYSSSSSKLGSNPLSFHSALLVWLEPNSQPSLFGSQPKAQKHGFHSVSINHL